MAAIALSEGASVEKVVNSHGWHNQFSLFVGEIEEESNDQLAESMIVDHSHAVIRFNYDVPAAAIEAVAAFTEAYPAVKVELTPNVGYSDKELRSAISTAHFSIMIAPGVLDVVTSYDQVDRKITSVAAVGDKFNAVGGSELLERANVSITNRLGMDVSAHLPQIGVELSPESKLSTLDSASYHYGGELLADGCTSGFGTRDNSPTSGTRRIATADHCDDINGDDADFFNSTIATQDRWWGDFQVHTGPRTHTDDFYAGNGSSLEVNLRDVSSVGSANVNQTVCKNGAAGFRDCQSVVNTYVCNTWFCNLTALTSRLALPGDSGGPIYYGNTAYGLHSGSATVNGAVRDVFSKALLIDEAIPGTGPHVATS